MQQTSFITGITLRQAALVTAIAYVLNPVTFAQGYAMPRLVVNDPAQTIANIHAHPHLFCAAVLCYFVNLFGDIIFAWSRYILLAPVNRALSLLAALLQLAYAAVSIAAVANLGTLYRLLLVPDYAKEINKPDLLTQTTVLVAGFHSGWGLGLILFGLQLALVGWLIAHSTYIPRWLGWVLFVTGWAWVVDSLSVYLFPNAPLGFLNILFCGEILFMIYLLGWGWRLKEPIAA